MKKTYKTPLMLVMEAKAEELICLSEKNGEATESDALVPGRSIEDADIELW